MIRPWIARFCIVSLLPSLPVAGQEDTGDTGSAAAEVRVHEIRRAGSAVSIDGVLDEPSWSEATEISIEYEWFSGNNVAPPVRTFAYVTYDDRNLYVAFRAYDPDPSQIRAQLMDRDQIDTLVQNDYVIVQLDTFNDQRRSYQFRVNPLGVQADACFPNTSAAQTWGFDVGRSYPRSTRFRMNASGRDWDQACWVCQFDKLTGFEDLRPGRNVELDPTLTASRTDERDPYPEGDLEQAEQDTEVGLTARWGITPSLSPTGTLNPDFSQVEADVAQRKAQAIVRRTFWDSENNWHDRWSVGAYANHIEDQAGQLTDEAVQVYARVTGPL